MCKPHEVGMLPLRGMHGTRRLNHCQPASDYNAAFTALMAAS